MSPWLELCRAAASDIRGVLDELPTRGEREPVLATGVGGDDTTAIAAAAERAVVARLEDLHRQGHEFLLVSEELGERAFGDFRYARGRRPDRRLDQREAWAPELLSLVYDFGSGEEWTATRGGGAQLDGKALGDVGPLSLCQLAAGRVDAVCSLRDARAVDIAAAQLVVRECGIPIAFVDAVP